MRSGKMDRRITLKRKVVTRDNYGGEIIAWTTIATVWAEKQEKSGTENFSGAQFVGEANLTFRIRWSNAVKVITDIHRVTFDGRDFDVSAVREIGRREGLEIDAYARAETPVAP